MLMPDASPEEIARAEETMERVFSVIYDICERIEEDRKAQEPDPSAIGS
jgi:hypothetical protein